MENSPQDGRPPESQPVSIQLLGSFSLRLGKGAEAPGSSSQPILQRRAVELLQLLSLQPERCLLSEQVQDALWPHLDRSAAGANLRKAAHHARHFIGEPGALVLQGGRVRLLPGREVHCDALEFERAADAALASGKPGACRAALSLYTGELLPGAAYDAWAEQPRLRLRSKYLRLLRGAGEFERLLQEDPTDEEACAALMRMALAAGRCAAALAHYGRMRDHLRQSLGVAPGPPLQTLYHECLAGLGNPAPAFVGRALELAQVQEQMHQAGKEACAGLLLKGEAGIGKTAFCRRLLNDARGTGWTVCMVQACDWTRPFGLVNDLVEPLLDQMDVNERAALGPHAQSVLAAMTALAGQLPAPALPIGRHQVVGAVRRLLLAHARGNRVLLIVDDVHMADDSSVELLAQLVASGAPVFVLLAGRPALTPLLLHHVRRLQSNGSLFELTLPPLSQDEAAMLAQSRAAQPLTADQVQEIASLAEGLPFAVVELVAVPQTRIKGQGWHMPRTVSGVIAQRLCDLDEASTAALQRLALCGESFDARLALGIASEREADAAVCLDKAVAAGVLEEEQGRYRFRHALLQQAMVNSIAPHRRIGMEREIARRLAHAGAAPGRIASHWLAAGEVAQAFPHALAAARAAFRLGGFQDVLNHVEPLLAHMPQHPEALALRAEAMDALARPGTLAAYDAAAAVAAPDLAQELKAKRALAQVKMSDPSGALTYLRDVHPVTVPGRLAEALAYCGAAALGFGTPDEGTRRAAEVRRLALQQGDEGTLVIASWAQAAAAHARGDLHGSVWADLRETSHLPHLATRVFDGHLCITQRFLYGSRPYPDVIAFADALAAEAERLDAARGRAFAITLRGEAKLLSGQLDAAEQDLLLGGRLHRAIGGATGEALSLQRRAELALYRNQRPLARALLDEALDVARQSDVGFHLLDRIYGTRIALARDTAAEMAALEEAADAVRGPLETCPGCRITLAIPATIAAARMRERELAQSYLQQSDYLAKVVMKLPAWYAALEEAQAHIAVAEGDQKRALQQFSLAAQRFREAGHPLDTARCDGLARGASHCGN